VWRDLDLIQAQGLVDRGKEVGESKMRLKPEEVEKTTVPASSLTLASPNVCINRDKGFILE